MCHRGIKVRLRLDLDQSLWRSSENPPPPAVVRFGNGRREVGTFLPGRAFGLQPTASILLLTGTLVSIPSVKYWSLEEAEGGLNTSPAEFPHVFHTSASAMSVSQHTYFVSVCAHLPQAFLAAQQCEK